MGKGIQKGPRNEAALLRSTIKLLKYLEMLGQLTFLRNQTTGIRHGGTWYPSPNKGSPDLLIWFRGGGALGLELKDPEGQPSPAQLKFRDRWERVGVPYHVADTPEGVVKLLRTYGATINYG